MSAGPQLARRPGWRRPGTRGRPCLAADPNDRPVPVTGPKVSAEQLGRAVHLRPGDVRRQPCRRAERQLGESGRHLAGVDRLETETGGKSYHRETGHLPGGETIYRCIPGCSRISSPSGIRCLSPESR